MPLAKISLYFMHFPLPSVHSPTQLCLCYHGNWFCLVCVSSLLLSLRFNRFSRGWRVADPAVVSLCVGISTFGLPFPMNVYSFCCWGNDAMTSVRERLFDSCHFEYREKLPIWELVWHCIQGTTCTLYRGRLWGSDDVTDTDAFQCGSIKSTQGQEQV